MLVYGHVVRHKKGASMRCSHLNAHVCSTNPRRMLQVKEMKKRTQTLCDTAFAAPSGTECGIRNCRGSVLSQV